MSWHAAPKCACCLPKISNYTRLTFHDSAKTARNVTQQSIVCQPGRARRRRVEQLLRHGLHECWSACHGSVVVRIWIFAPMSVDACVLVDADDWAVLRARTRATAVNEHGSDSTNAHSRAVPIAVEPLSISASSYYPCVYMCMCVCVCVYHPTNDI